MELNVTLRADTGELDALVEEVGALGVEMAPVIPLEMNCRA